MKNKFKNIGKYCAIISLFIVFAIIIDSLVFNFNLLVLNNKEKGIREVNDYTEEVTDKNKLININLEDKYINKLVITYETTEDCDIVIDYVEDDYYGNDKKNQLTDILDNEVNEQIINYKNKVKNITITMDKDSDIAIKDITIHNEFKINYFRVIYLICIMIVLYCIYHFYKNGANSSVVHKYFFIVGLVIGVTMIILQPSATFYSWDDQDHFLNTYELIGGDIDWKIGEVSMIDYNSVGRNSINSLEEQENQKKYLNQDIITPYSTYSGHFITYNKVAYIPSAIGFYLCKFLHFPFVICFKMGKVMNLIVYLLLMSYAIKIAKNGKRLLTVIGLIPTSIFLACQYSYDPAVTSGLTLGMVCIFNWLLDKKSKVDFKSMSIFIFFMLYGCFPKAVYAPLLLLFLFVPKNRFQNKKQSLILKSGIVIVSLLLLSTFVLPTVTNTMGADSRGGETSVALQLELIMHNPFGYVKVLKDTMINRFMSNFLGKDILFFYGYIGKCSDNLYLGFLTFMLFVFFTEETKNSLNNKNKIILSVCIGGVILMIWTALYLAFTPVGLTTINGVQPRYFIPLLFPMSFIFKTNKIKNNISSKVYNTLVVAIPSILIIISLYQMFLLNYCM